MRRIRKKTGPMLSSGSGEVETAFSYSGAVVTSGTTETPVEVEPATLSELRRVGLSGGSDHRREVKIRKL